jgi:ABC-type lipoprotein release transport system permease subunit
MKDYQLAWKNLWRNRRRTLITAASVFFAVFFALVMRSFQLGVYDRMFKNVIESYSGYLQLQHEDYFDDPNIDNSFEIDQVLINDLKEDQNVKDVVPRLESFALAASGNHTQGVIVMGIDPEGEDRVLNIRNRLVRYKLKDEVVDKLINDTVPERTKKLLDIFRNEAYTNAERMMQDLDISEEDSASILPVIRRHASFHNEFLTSDNEEAAVIGEGLSDYLQTDIGDTIVLISQGYHGTSAAGKYVIKGIVKLSTPDVDNKIVYLPLETARYLYAAPGMSTTAVISLNSNDDDDILETGMRLRDRVSEPLTVKTWQELNALLVNQMDADNKSGIIMIAILYLVIAFGVFGTVLMMMAERKREFGMLVSIGMQKHKLAKIISLEMLFIGFLGIVAGSIASLPVVFYGNIHPLRFTGEFARMYEDYGFEPIMPTMMPDSYYIWQTVVVLIILVIAIAFSSRKIFKMNVINALRA